jgi:hypothetical protein
LCRGNGSRPCVLCKERKVAMAKVPWHLFQERKPRAHLVVRAIFDANEPAGLADSTAALAVLRRVVRKQKPADDYAAAVMRDDGWPEVYFAFNEEADAQKFAGAVQAEPIESLAGWASRHAFEMDATRIRALEALLPPSGKPPYKKSPWKPLRRGSRAPVRRYDE